MDPWDERAPGVIVLPDGRRLRGRGLRTALPIDEPAPEFGAYLTGRPHRESAWESRWVCWPDFRLPRSVPDAVAALHVAFERSAEMRVEIACDGGTGRTGTAIAILARFAGVPAPDAVAWARTHYRPRAVETPGQRRLVRRVQL